MGFQRVGHDLATKQQQQQLVLVIATQLTTTMMKVTKTIIVIILLNSYSCQGMYSSLYMISQVKNKQQKNPLMLPFYKGEDLFYLHLEDQEMET